MELGLEIPEVAALHRSWDLDVAREKENRTRFAQRALKPDEVSQELKATDAVMGDPDAVRLFVLSAPSGLACKSHPTAARTFFASSSARSPRQPAHRHRRRAATTKTGHWFVSFISPTPEGAEYLGRNHRFVATLAQFLMEEALTKGAAARASRCGAMRTAPSPG